jgi:dTDP-4-amino-4,6-dideoxygalactose transaminase
MRNWGADKKYNHDCFGGNFRLHTIQAKFLSLKLEFLQKENSLRRLAALYYYENLPKKLLRSENFDSNSTFHIFEVKVKNRRKCIKFLTSRGVTTSIHYPKAIHQNREYWSLRTTTKFKNAEYFAKTTLSIPLFPYISEKELDYVMKVVSSDEFLTIS